MNDPKGVLTPAVEALVCTGCGAVTHDPWGWTCDSCDASVRRDVRYASDAGRRMRAALASRPFTMWRYAELLPVTPPRRAAPALAVGGTPVIESDRLARALGIARAVVKDEARNVSGSLKDRASAIGVSLALADGRRAISCASTGNAAASTATLAAAVGLPAVVLIPAKTAAGKLAQLRACGAVIGRVAAPYDDVWEMCSAIGDRAGWLNRNCAVNPYLVEGKKTAGLEIAEQLGEAIPDWVAVGVGDGCTLAGIGKGLLEARDAGLIPRVPRLLGVQPSGVQPIVRAFEEGGEAYTASPHSIADGLNVGRPRNALKALAMVRATQGTLLAVPDEAILEAMGLVARVSGLLVEPASAAAFAGVREARARGVIAAGESVCVVNTGTGLKDPGAIDSVPSLSEAVTLDAGIDAALAVLERTLTAEANASRR